MDIKALSYNIHKGLNWNNSVLTLEKLRSFIRATSADIVFLQEVVGENRILPKKFSNWVDNQHEFLADSIWDDYAYSKNAVFDKRHHGNAILSKYPIVKTQVIDLTIHKREMRAILYCQIKTEEGLINLLCTHLNLLHFHRIKQYPVLNQKIQELLNENHPLILAGDFNDWFGKAKKFISTLDHVASSLNAKDKSFPHFRPSAALDHFFTSNVKLKHFEVLNPKDSLSDHLPIYFEGEVF